MSVIGSNIIAGASGTVETGYQIARSLRFNSADSAYLNRTPGSAGNRKTWTWSGWVKPSASTVERFLSAGTSDTNLTEIYFDSNSKLNVFHYPGSTSMQLTTTQVFRDFSSWYHILVAVDTTQATASNRAKVYVNGMQVTAFSTATYPAQNTDTFVNATNLHYTGRSIGSTIYSNQYLAEINFIDGQALDPTSFGETDSATGVWVPKAYAGTYGTNGFWLKLDDNSNTTAATLGKDSSGNGNNWTPNNFSVTAGVGNDSLVDSPTNYGTDTGAGGEVRGNYATLNPLAKFASTSQTPTLANGNLDISGVVSSSYSNAVSTLGFSSGKWYAEYTVGTLGTANGIGFVNAASLASVDGNYGIGAPSDGWLRVGTSVLSNSASAVTGLSTIASNDIVMLAIDFDAGKAWWGRNGTWESSGNPATGANATVTFTPGGKTFLFGNAGYSASVAITGSVNYGQRPFAYTAPSGFKALCTQNLPTPTIGTSSTTLADDYFNIALYTGNGTAIGSGGKAVTGLGFQPDFVWIKGRSGATDHSLFDAIRGTTKLLESNTTDAESTQSESLTTFGSDGFTVGSLAQVNTNTATYVGWAWKANGAGSSNTAGSISSTVSVNTTAGFSIVTFTGSGANATVGHGLGVAPGMIILKGRSQSGGYWRVYTSALGATKTLYMNVTDTTDSSSLIWNNTAPTSTVFSIGTDPYTNTNGSTYVAYCFAEIAGFSKFGSYTGNASTNGPFVYTGFRPKFVMVKNSSATGSWWIEDSSRSPYNVGSNKIAANSSDAESTGFDNFDFLSNGFKVRNSGTEINGSGNTIIFMAFAEFPFQYARAR